MVLLSCHKVHKSVQASGNIQTDNANEFEAFIEDEIYILDGSEEVAVPVFSTRHEDGNFVEGQRSNHAPSIGLSFDSTNGHDRYDFVYQGLPASPSVLKEPIYCTHIVGPKNFSTNFLRRILMCPSDDEMFPFKFTRKQFPVCVSFAMTINKAQRQTIPNVGIYLPEPVFSHGRLYVTLQFVIFY